jgi:glyoxylase-like metal-dependent hydrolase (beta-lactamase superfamily II)
LAVVGLLASIVASFPTPQGERVKSGELVGIDSGGAYVWIVPTADHGVVLIDAGMDPEANILKGALAGRPVHAILITHGHGDHVVGLDAFGDIPVYVGPGEAPLARGEALPKGQLARLFARLMTHRAHRDIREVRDGEILTFDDQSFEVLHVPGHTAGSVVYLWKDVAFTGDSLLGHEASVAPVHWVFADDYDQNLESLKRLLERDFSRIADGHAGVHDGAKARLGELLR